VVKATGGRLPSGETSSFPQQVGDLIPEPLRPAVAPVLEVIDRLNEAAYEYDCLLEHWAGTRYEESSRLTQNGCEVGVIQLPEGEQPDQLPESELPQLIERALRS
jgi:hypothetical protein